MSFYYNINPMKHLIILTLLVISSGSWASVISQVPDSSKELVKVYVKQDPATYKKEKGDAALVLEFAVQLSASSRPITDKSTLKSWEELGPLYIHEENGMFKVRLGPFDTQDKAKEVLLQAKQRGKKDAFIVIQKGLENYHQPEGFAKQETPAELEPVHTASPAPAEATVATAPVAPAADVTNSDEIIEYKVRLASYLKPGGFSTKDIDQYGPLESYRKGDWTILMIGGFKTEQEAIKVRDQVIAKGFKDAAVVVSRDGMIDLEH